MNTKRLEIQDKRNIIQRVIGVLFLEKCPKCNKYAFAVASYGEEGHCSVCSHTTPSLILEGDEEKIQ